MFRWIQAKEQRTQLSAGCVPRPVPGQGNSDLTQSFVCWRGPLFNSLIAATRDACRVKPVSNEQTLSVAQGGSRQKRKPIDVGSRSIGPHHILDLYSGESTVSTLKPVSQPSHRALNPCRLTSMGRVHGHSVHRDQVLGVNVP